MRVILIVFKILFIFILIQSGILQIIPSGRSCTAQGYFEIIDGTCKNYYLCLYNGVAFVSYDLKCLDSTVFNPITNICTADYICNQITTMDPCPFGVGRFPISDSNCQKYYFCYVDNGSFVRYNLTCPNNLLFNSKTKQCMLPCPTSSQTSLSCTSCNK